MTAFRWGAVVGFAVPILLVALMKAWIGPSLYSPKFNVEVVSRGADVSRHGGAKVIVRDGRGVVAEQTCRQVCDDFELQLTSPDNEFGVGVLNSAGRSLVSSEPMYVTNGYGASITRWTISGQSALEAQLSFIDREADGTFRERPFEPRTTPPGNLPGTPSP